MKTDSEFKTFININSKNLAIRVFDLDKNIIYQNSLSLKNDSRNLDLNLISDFLDKNIFKIEKILGKFVNNIFLIIDHKDFFSIKISLKKKIYDEFITTNDVNNLLIEAKNQCKKTLENKKIVHMKIDNYKIDDKDYSELPNNLKCNYLSLLINFICLPNNVVKDLEKILKNYHISISKIVSYNYLSEFIQPEDDDIFLMSEKLIDGYNKNEILFINKNQENQGFFEKFFNFFS